MADTKIVDNLQSDLKNKIIDLQNALNEELLMHKPISFDLDKIKKDKLNKLLQDNLEKIQNTYDKDDLNNIHENLKKLDDDINHFIDKKKNSDRAKNLIKKIRERVKLRKIDFIDRYENLVRELHGIMLCFVYGIRSIAINDEFVKRNSEILDMEFKPRNNLGQKAAFLILKIKSKKLAKLIVGKTSVNEIKERFIVEMENINNTDYDLARTNRIKKIALKVKSHLINQTSKAIS